MYKRCMPPYKTLGTTMVSSLSRVIFTTAARLFFRVEYHTHPPFSVRRLISRACLSKRGLCKIPLHRHHRPSSSHKCQDNKAARQTKPTCAKSSNTCLSFASTIALPWLHAPYSMSCVIIPVARLDTKPGKANACSKTTITQSIEVALQLGNTAHSDRARGPRHHALSSARVHWECVKNRISCEIRPPAPGFRRMTLCMSRLASTTLKKHNSWGSATRTLYIG